MIWLFHSFYRHQIGSVTYTEFFANHALHIFVAGRTGQTCSVELGDVWRGNAVELARFWWWNFAQGVHQDHRNRISCLRWRWSKQGKNVWITLLFYWIPILPPKTLSYITCSSKESSILIMWFIDSGGQSQIHCQLRLLSIHIPHNFQLNGLRSEMQAIYSTGEVCNRPSDEDPENTCYPLEPGIMYNTCLTVIF